MTNRSSPASGDDRGRLLRSGAVLRLDRASGVLIPDRRLGSDFFDMVERTQANADFECLEAPEPDRMTEAAVLWSAIEADRRALDERTARLRAMHLICGDDESVEPA